MSDAVSDAAGNSIMALAADFDRPERDQWMALVEQALRGAPFDKKLVHTTYDGISIQPLYTAADRLGTDQLGTGHLADHPRDESLPGVAPFTRGASAEAGPWQVRQAHSPAPGNAGTGNVAPGNAAIADDLDNGVDAIELHLAGEWSVAELARLLDGVDPAVPIMLSPSSGGAVWALVALWEERGVAPAAARGGFGIDPRHEVVPQAMSHAGDYPQVMVATVDAARLADRGASEAQELAGSLADGVACLRACEQAGIDLQVAASVMEFRFAAGVDQFLTVAKLRAARRLWARVTEACGIAPAPQRQHAVTAGAMMARRDPWVNMVRTTVACFAAAAGGADAITVAPFDSAIGVPDALGRRIARNTGLLLREESHLHRVIDPAGGSYYVESLTDALAQAAWELFQRLEGGAELSPLIEETSAARARDVATRRLPLTGVSEFADLDETPLDRPEAPLDPDLRRLAEPFEALRDTADAAPAQPVAFLANLGSPAVHSARSAFAANLLAAGGVRARASDGYDTPGGAAEAWGIDRAPVAVVCSSDEMYESCAAAAVDALRQAGCGYVLVAGRPDDRWGADGHIYTGCDALAALTVVHQKLGL